MCAPSSARERNLLNIMSYIIAAKTSMASSFAIMDKSQSITRTQFRDDGNVPTVCTTSSMWVFSLGRELTAAEIATLFGHQQTPFGGQTEASVKRLLGNSMHLAEVGVIIGAMHDYQPPSHTLNINSWQVGTLLSTAAFLKMGLLGRQ